MRKTPTTPPHGVTLLECIVCMGLAVAVLTMGLEALRVCRSIGTRSAVMTSLSLAAQETLAEASTAPFDSLSSGTVRIERVLGGSSGPGSAGVAADLGRRVSPLGPDLKEITIEATWSGAKDPLRVTLSTRVARRAEENR